MGGEPGECFLGLLGLAEEGVLGVDEALSDLAERLVEDALPVVGEGRVRVNGLGVELLEEPLGVAHP